MNDRKGASLVIAVMVVSAALFVIAVTNINVGIGDADLSLISSKGEQAYAVAEGCAQEALRQMRRTSSYGVGAGTITFTTSLGSCTIDIIDLGGNQRRVSVVGTTGGSSRRLMLTATVGGTMITIQSWQEF